MQVLLTIFALSIATLIATIFIEEVEPGHEGVAATGGLAILATFVSGLLSALAFIWS